MASVIVTGVSRGLGSALFDEILAAGHRVLALGRRFTPRQHASAGSTSGRVQLRPTDLADRLSLPSGAELAAFAAGAAQVALVHNAAVIEPLGAIGTLQVEQVLRAVMINFIAPMLLTNALLSALSGGASGPAFPGQLTVLFISSGAARRVSGGRVLYSATKRASETFFEGLAAQHNDDPRIRTAIIDPGIMDTDMQTSLRDYARGSGYFPDRERFVRLAEQGLLPSPAQVAKKIVGEHLA